MSSSKKCTDNNLLLLILALLLSKKCSPNPLPPPPPHPPKKDKINYLFTYNNKPQAIPLNSPIIFHFNGAIDPSGVITHDENTAEIIINAKGTYDISFKVVATSSCQIALFLNNNLITQSISGTGISEVPNVGHVIVKIHSPSVLVLRNYLSKPSLINLATNVGGIKDEVNSYIIITRIDY